MAGSFSCGYRDHGWSYMQMGVADELQLQQGRHAVIEADLFGDLAVLYAALLCR
jgi:hypothetical protein